MASVGSVHDEAVPPLIRKAAAWSWRLLVIIALAVALLWVIRRLELIVVPVALALMLTALMIPGGRLPGSPRRAPRRRGGAGAAERNRDRRRLADVRRQPVRHRPARTRRTGHPDHRDDPHVADRGSRAPEQGPDHQRGQLGHRSAAQQPGEADQRCAVDGGHRDRNRHGRTACAVHPDLLPARRAKHLAVRHEDLPGERPGAGARRGPGRIPVAHRLCARDVSRRAGRRRRDRYRAGHHGRAAGPAVGLAGLPRCLHPVGRCGHRRVPRRRRRAARQRLRLRADHARAHHRSCSNWKATCCSRW